MKLKVSLSYISKIKLYSKETKKTKISEQLKFSFSIRIQSYLLILKISEVFLFVVYKQSMDQIWNVFAIIKLSGWKYNKYKNSIKWSTGGIEPGF